MKISNTNISQNRLSGLILILSLLLCASCHRQILPLAEDPSAVLVSGVPFCKQKRNSCAAATLYTLALFEGVDWALEDVEKHLPVLEKKGALVFDMVGAARRIGLDYRVQKGTLETLFQSLESGHPVITMLDVSTPWIFWHEEKYHFLVVTGLSRNQQVVRVNDGYQEGRIVSIASFEKQWDACQRWMMSCSKEV